MDNTSLDSSQNTSENVTDNKAKDASHRRSDTAIARIPYPRRRASDWIAVFIQLLLAIAAIWYTVETRRLRLQSKDQMNLMENQSKLLKDQLHLYEDQTHLLRDQSRLSIAPYLSPGLVDIDLQELKKKTLEDKDLSTEERRERLNTIENSDVKFMCSVQNTSSKIPYNLNVYIYDVRTRSFLQNDYSQEYIKENDYELFQLSGPYYSKDQVTSQIKEDYGDHGEFIFNQLEVGDESYIALIFQDLEGRVYLSKRKFSIDDSGEVQHKPSVLLHSE